MLFCMLDAKGVQIDLEAIYALEAMLLVEFEAVWRRYDVCGKTVGVCEGKTMGNELGGEAPPAVRRGGQKLSKDL